MFRGYLFVYGTEDERTRGLTTNRVVRFIKVPDQAGLCGDLLQVRRTIESGAAVSYEPELTPGRVVRVSAGPLLGLVGTIQARRGAWHLLVAVRLLQQGVSLKIDADQVEPLD
jgi:hypothetical protein